MVNRLLDADSAGVTEIIDNLEPSRFWAEPVLKEEFDRQPNDSPKKLHAALALLRGDDSYLDYVFDRLVQAPPQEIWLLRKEFQPHQDILHKRLWNLVSAPTKPGSPQFLSGSCLLACLPAGKDADWRAERPDQRLMCDTMSPL